MRLLRVDSNSNKVTEIKTFEPLKSKHSAITTAMEQDSDGGKYLLDEGDGGYYEFDVRIGSDGTPSPHFFPGEEGYHEGVPERHLARLQSNPDSLRSTKEKYGDFMLDVAGDAPEENPFATPPAPAAEETVEEIGSEEEEAAAPTEAETETETEVETGAEVETGTEIEAEAAVTTEPVEGGEDTNAVEEIIEETAEEPVEEPVEGDGEEAGEDVPEAPEGGSGEETVE